jgi:peptidoglycan/LPS O-acetylase OafA/YrhL
MTQRVPTWATIFDGPAITTYDGEARVGRRADRKNDKSGEKTFRADIQGLRAVAVLAVLFNHLTTILPGGFVGVDIFFVISGYLITGLLVNESARDGRISWLGFYKRRARRILPAAVTVLLACFIAAHLVFKGARVRQSVSDIWWALGFSANVHFSRIGTDYFANQAPSIVQHFWSLAVEEQFYLIWPIVVIVLLSGVGRLLDRPAVARALLLVAVAGATAASFVFAIQETNSSPTGAYFSTFTRTWELGIGAVLAVAVRKAESIARLLGRARGPLVALGMVGIATSLFVVKSDHGFPAPDGALPVLATALVILAGTGGPTGAWAWLLTNPLSVYIGLISYSLYLWHWPVIVVCQALVPTSSQIYYPMAILAIAGVTLLGYHFIEAPFHKPAGATEHPRRNHHEKQGVPRSMIALAAATAVVLAAACYVFRANPPEPNFAVPATTNEAAQVAVDPKIAQPPAALASALDNALATSIWPKFQPSTDLLGIKQAQRDWGGCRRPDLNLAGCTFAGSPSNGRVAVVVGDSMSLAWIPAVRAALVPKGWTVIGLSRELCPAADVIPAVGGTVTARIVRGCAEMRTFVVNEIQTLKPALVILSSIYDTLTHMQGGATGSAAIAQYEAGMISTERAVAAPGRKVVTLSPPPRTGNLLSCYTATSRPADCVAPIAQVWRNQSSADAAAAQATHTTYVDTQRWFCNAAGYCPAFVGSTLISYDGEHLTPTYGVTLAPELATALGVR